MARKKPTYKCFKCKAKLGSAAVSYAHFQDNPSHRSAKQLKDYRANRALNLHRNAKQLALNRRGSSQLPVISRKMQSGRTMKFCTECGNRPMPSHNYCGGCGGKL